MRIDAHPVAMDGQVDRPLAAEIGMRVPGDIAEQACCQPIALGVGGIVVEQFGQPLV